MAPIPEDIDIEVSIAREDKARKNRVMSLGEFSPFTCPECHGTLIQLDDARPLRFRCHTGHAFSVNSLLSALSENVEDSLWTSIRVIEESAMLLRHMAVHMSEQESAEDIALLLQKALDAQNQANQIRQTVFRYEKFTEDEIEKVEGVK